MVKVYRLVAEPLLTASGMEILESGVAHACPALPQTLVG